MSSDKQLSTILITILGESELLYCYRLFSFILVFFSLKTIRYNGIMLRLFTSLRSWPFPTSLRKRWICQLLLSQSL